MRLRPISVAVRCALPIPRGANAQLFLAAPPPIWEKANRFVVTALLVVVVVVNEHKEHSKLDRAILHCCSGQIIVCCSRRQRDLRPLNVSKTLKIHEGEWIGAEYSMCVG